MRLFIKEILETLAIAVVAFIIINTSVQNYMVEGTSMMPNIGDDDYLLVNKLSYIEFNKLLTEDGLNLLKNKSIIKKIIYKLKKKKIRTSLFINPNLNDIKISKNINANFIESVSYNHLTMPTKT